MALGTIASGAFGLGKTLGIDFGGALDSIGSFFGLGNNRDEKRAARKKIRSAIHSAGVNSNFASNTHSDDWKELKKLAEWLRSTGQEGIDYINAEYGNQRTFGPSKGGPTAQNIISGFQSWVTAKRRRQQRRQQAQEQSQGGGTSQAAAGPLGLSWPVIGVAIAAIYMILNLMKQ